jgi:hypothetical protein
MTTGTYEENTPVGLGTPRRGARLALTAVLWVATFTLQYFGGYVFAWLGGAPWENNLTFYGDESPWTYGVLPGITTGVGAVLYVVMWGWLASLVDYRWRDGLLVLVPVVEFFFVAKWIYRLVGFRARDWQPAPTAYPISRAEALLRRLGTRIRTLSPW